MNESRTNGGSILVKEEGYCKMLLVQECMKESWTYDESILVKEKCCGKMPLVYKKESKTDGTSL